MKIGFIGIGKLGQPCAEVMAEHYDVIGYDIAPRYPENFPMASTIKEAVIGRDIIFVAIQTPHDPKYGGDTPTTHLNNVDFDYSYVQNTLIQINQHTTKKQLVVLISTVLPGTTRRELIQFIPNARFIYNPYLIAMGTVAWDMINPEMIIIGTEDGDETSDAKILIDLYKPMMENQPRYIVGTWDEAECIKIFYNTFISVKLSIVNMIQDVAEKNGNINVDIVTRALANSTQRIMSSSYMTAGMGDGGPCHPRDNIALRYMAEKLDLGYDLFDAIMHSREIQAENIALKLLKYNLPICIIGKAYKSGVPYTDGSYSLLVGHYVKENGNTVKYYDPNTGDTDFPDGPTVFLISYWEDWVYELQFPTNSIVIDPWRHMNKQENITVIHYGNTRVKNNDTLC